MEIGRKWRFSCLLLGLFFLATTLQGVQGEVESEGPSESECRPYIEKALKELETAEAEHLEPRTPSDGDGESTEDIPIVEQTIDDSEHVPSDGEDDIEEIETKDTEQEGASTEQEATETAESKEAGEEDVAASAEQTEDQPEEPKEESIEQPDEAQEEQADEPQAESAEEAPEAAEASAEQQEEVAEAEGEGEQEGSIEETEAADSVEKTDAEEGEREEGASVEEAAAQSQEDATEAADEAAEEGEKSAEEEAVEEDAAKSAEEAGEEEDAGKSAEEAEKSAEEEDTAKSAEEAAASAEETEAPAEEGAVSAEEEAAASVEEGATSVEEAAASAEEGAASAEEAEEAAASAEEAAGSVEEAAASVEEAAASAEEAAASAEEAAASAEEAGAASAEEAAASTEEAAASAEEAGASVEDAAASAEEVAASAEEAAASAEEAAASAEEATASAEEAAASVEEAAASVEDAAASAEETAASAEEAAASVEEAEEAGKSVEEQDEEKTSDDAVVEESARIVKRSIPDGAEAPEYAKSAETEADGESLEELAEPAEGTEAASAEEKEGEAAETKEGEGEAEEEQKEEVPEEELTLEIEIPEDLRPRDHIEQLLKLEDTEVETAINRISEVTLRELKKLYENAIKPLETLYKYRDLSNRHFGDSEVFSKPLVLFMGPWSGGKSSIINYLLNNEYNTTSLRTGAEPSPAYFNILMHGDEPEVLDGTQLAADFTFAGLQKFGQGLEERLRGLKLPSKLLEKINIVEIPGILEVRKQVSRIFPFNDACQWFIDRADIIFLVYDPSKLDVGPETEAILDQLKGREHQTRIVLNKADQVKPEELMRVQSALIWNISPLMSSAQPPVMYTTSLWSRPYEAWAPVRLLQAQERAFLRDLRSAVDKRIENKISSARRFAVRVRNHAKMVDCYLTTYYNHKSVFGNRKQVSDQIIEHPQDYHIYEGLSTLTNISRYDLPDPDVYRDFFRLNPLYDFQQLSATCTYFRGCPINRLDVAIAYDLPEMVGKHKKMVEAAVAELKTES